MKPDGADPALPRQVAAGATETFGFMFPGREPSYGGAQAV